MPKLREKFFDPKCYELAEAFLEDEPSINTSGHRNELASDIQDAIESFIKYQLDNYEPADPMAHVEFPFAENHWPLLPSKGTGL